MRRADRLFRIVQMLRSGRLKTAGALAERLQVSERTIYRDVRDLQLAGQPIEGEAGVGYTLRREFDLPPLMFSPEELTAIVLGARLVRAWGGAENATAAGTALARIEAVLPAALADSLDAILLYAPGFQMQPPLRKLLDRVHAACVARRALHFAYAPGWRALRAHRAAAGAVLLERNMDAGGLVRAAQRLPRLPPGPHRAVRGAGARV
jgi:predicted DNA-binding transcriptional regulator YafY